MLTVSVVDASGVEDAGVGGSVADLHLDGEADHADRGQQQRLGQRRRRRLGRRGRRRRLRLPGAGHGGGGEGREGEATSRDPKKARGKDQRGRGRVTRFGGGNAPQVVPPFVFLSGMIHLRRTNLEASRRDYVMQVIFGLLVETKTLFTFLLIFLKKTSPTQLHINFACINICSPLINDNPRTRWAKL